MSFPEDRVAPSSAEPHWEWALEEQTRIGRVRIWLWRESPPADEDLQGLGDPQVRGMETGDGVAVEIGDERVEIYVGAQLDISQHTVEVKTRTKIEIGLKTFPPGDAKREDRFEKTSARFGLARLKNDGVGRLCCGRCRNELVDGLDGADVRWYALPSEDWAEFVEYWVCHEDMKVKAGDSVGCGAGNGLRKPRPREGFLGDWFLLLDLDWVENIASQGSKSIGWRRQAPQKAAHQPTRKHFVECNRCGFTLGEVEEDVTRHEPPASADKILENPEGGPSGPNRRWIRFYKRAISSSTHWHAQDDEADGRGFEISLIEDEVSKLVESNGFYKVAVKNMGDSRSIGLWIFCPSVLIRCRRRPAGGDARQPLSRAKLMYVVFEGDGSPADLATMERFETGARNSLGSERRIGEICVPADHFELLLAKLSLGSIYRIGQPIAPFSPPGPVPVSQPLDDRVSGADDDEDLFQGIYRVAYL
ncbi:hypothetical protein PTTG_25620 [Puccinia triticina 1-1 BBBD Race 1]|uniref:Uncharacterized protein n=1 Tax=Puccinia triticina (isolate 1-1 / race 1 (BBBD)) TaxID=630390 RepID=A0A180H0Y3_PUCT1|nr:hypothetical protein PTTG_25620 [Puccinia triticina 1-1 BBBD Race 1]